MAKTIKKEEVVKEPVELGTVIAWIFAALMFSFFLLFYTDYYFNILQSKYGCYLGIAGVSVGAFIIGMIFRKVKIDWHFSLQDIFLTAFFAICTISTLLASPYIFEAFFGNEGRYTGELLMIAYCLTFFLFSRTFKHRHWVFDFFLYTALFLNLFAITDYFDMNILHFKDNIDEGSYRTFTSTIGNINTFTAFAGMAMACTSSIFIFRDNKDADILDRGFYLLCTYVGFHGLIVAQSDNAYLALLAFFAIAPFFAWKGWREFRRYFLTLCLFLGAMEHVNITNHIYGDAVIAPVGIYSKVVESGLLLPALIVVILFTVFLYVYSNKNRLQEDLLPKWLRPAWAVLMGVCLVGGIGIIIWANCNPEACAEKFSSMSSYLVFTDSWGTSRGYIWRAAIEEYGDLPLIHKIFGTGPDTFGIYMVTDKYVEMVTTTGQYYDSAHNEYIQYFFTIGPFGLIAYLGLIISIIVGCIKKAATSENRYILIAIVLTIICYCSQAVVNINLPVITPVFWTFMTIGAALIRDVKPKEKKPAEGEQTA